MCETIEKAYKLNSEDLAVLKTNQKQLEKAYCKGAIPYLTNIKVITLVSNVNKKIKISFFP